MRAKKLGAGTVFQMVVKVCKGLFDVKGGVGGSLLDDGVVIGMLSVDQFFHRQLWYRWVQIQWASAKVKVHSVEEDGRGENGADFMTK